MSGVLLAMGRALRSLREPGILWHMLWPALLAILLWTLGAVWSWNIVVGAIMDAISTWPLLGTWMNNSEIATGTMLILVKIALVLALIPLIYVTAAMLVSLFALPMMLERVGVREYAELEQRHGGTNLGSVRTTLWAGLVFLFVLVISLPFWLIPGVGLVVSVGLTGWMNQRAFGYDALMLHADRDELRHLPRSRSEPMLLLGCGCALLAYVPLVNLFAPAFCGLAFVHFMLETLRRERAQRGVSILDPLRDGGVKE